MCIWSSSERVKGPPKVPLERPSALLDGLRESLGGIFLSTGAVKGSASDGERQYGCPGTSLDSQKGVQKALEDGSEASFGH